MILRTELLPALPNGQLPPFTLTTNIPMLKYIDNMSLQDKRHEMESFEDEAEVRVFLQDLLRKIGFCHVIDAHEYGNVEHGKDIIARVDHRIDGAEWHAFVVKKDRISGSAKDIEGLKSQIKQCFEHDYPLSNGEEIKIDKVKVVSNGNITKGARTTLNDSSELKFVGSVNFWDRDRLIDLVDENYPNFWRPHSLSIQEFCKNTRDKLDEEITIKNLGEVKVDDNNSEKLLNLFVEPKLIEKKITRKRRYKDDKEEYEDFEENKIRFNSLRNSEDNFLITGGPGSGKTRIVEEIIKHYSDPKVVSDQKVLPIKLEIPRWERNNRSVSKAIEEQIIETFGRYYDRVDTSEYTKLILVDSIDFMGEEKRKELVRSLSKYESESKCRFIIAARATRGLDFEEWTSDVREVKVLSFDRDDAVTFVTKFFDSDEEKKQFLSILKQNNLLNKIPKTPLTLSLLSILYEEEQKEVPATQTDIYKDFTQVLLGKYSMESREDYLKLNLITRLLSVISLGMLDKGESSIYLEEFTKRVNRFLSNRDYSSMEVEEVKNFLENTGFMYIDTQNEVGFKHISFLEFFASREIYHHKKEYSSKLINKFTHPNWQNTAVFYAGRSKDMPGFISDLLKNLPTEKTSDIASSVGGMGYISQALYLTDSKHRKDLVRKSLKCSLKLLQELKKLTDVEGNPYYGISPQGIVSAVAYLFRYSFSSKTLEKVLKDVYDEIDLEDEIEGFEEGFDKFLLASTLMHRNIDDPNRFEKLLTDDSFQSNPTLIMSGDIFLSNGDIIPSDSKKESLKEVLKDNMKKYDKLIKHIIDKPAHEFDDEYLIDNS